MKYFHHLRIRLIGEPSSIDEQIDSVLEFIGYTDMDEKDRKQLSIEKEEDEGVSVALIWIKKEKLVRKLAKDVQSIEGSDVFNDSLDNRIFDDGYLYVRTNEDFSQIITGGKCVHFAFKVAAYPRGLERARLVARQFFQR